MSQQLLGLEDLPQLKLISAFVIHNDPMAKSYDSLDSLDSEETTQPSRELYGLARVLVANVCMPGGAIKGASADSRTTPTRSCSENELRRIAVQIANQLYPTSRVRRRRNRSTTRYGRPVLTAAVRQDPRPTDPPLNREIESLERAISKCEQSGTINRSQARRLRSIERRLSEALSR